MHTAWARLARGPVKLLSRNDLYQRIEAIKRNRRKRAEYGECFVESVAAIEAAVCGGWEVHALLQPAGIRVSGWALDLPARCPSAAILHVQPELLAELSERDETSEIVAIVGTRRPSLASIAVRAPFCALVLDRPSSPGNLGSILRSCDAFGVNGVAIRGHAADLYDPQTIRASLGAVFSVPVAADRSNAEIGEWLVSLRRDLPGLQLVGTSPAADTSLFDADLSRPTVVALGNERSGMSEWLRQTADRTVSIPSRGSVDSLNLAAAATVVLYEITRQRELSARALPAHGSSQNTVPLT
jgi:23S rRNA (uridine2479-2'-O)-methyltransferase